MMIDRTKLEAMISELLPKNKRVIESQNRKGVLCFRCGRSTLALAYTTEVDGHVKHSFNACMFVRLRPCGL